MASFNLPKGYSIRSVDRKVLAHQTVTAPSVAQPSDSIISPAKTPPVPPPATDPLSTQSTLGVLTSFMGTYAGTGFNTIFRPKSKTDQTPFNNPVILVKSDADDNILQMNLTTEQLTFSNGLGDIPNRGLGSQPDVKLHGVGYLQTIQDVTNGDPVDIHFEPGLWISVPATVVPPRKASLSRMASIPHGTTINAQSTSQPQVIQGALVIPEYEKFQPMGTTPFKIGATPKDPKDVFDSMDFHNNSTSRIPQDLSTFIRAGTITPEILRNPHKVLNDINKQRKILRSVVFTVSTEPTDPKKPLLGGGTDNIDFLVGNGPTPDSTPNARAVSMSSIFWISTVQLDIVVPPMKVSDGPKCLPRHDPTCRVPLPCFEIIPPYDLTAPKTITVEYVQIQYSQTVILNFAGDSWPHVSVATLVPQGALPVPKSVWQH
jgi:hypothetical protein